MRAFKVGDRVRGPRGLYGSMGDGTIVGGYDLDEDILVSFDNWYGGHSGSGAVDNNSAWYCAPEELTLIHPDPATATDEEWNYDPRQEVIIIGTPDAIRKLFA